MNSQAMQDVIDERIRQQDVQGWSTEHDDEHTKGQLALAAAEYAFHGASCDEERAKFPAGCPSDAWPWEKSWWKPKDPRRDLVRAAALIVAEIERLDRAAK